jgi:dihydrofolate synthase/folylpolyglutamate synthase
VTATLPTAIRSRGDLDSLLALATNYEERIPADAVPRPFDLSRMEALLASVGDPHLAWRPAHVAGSKGKGSTCRMVAAGLEAAGCRPVGLYTSPHLTDLTERVAVDGRPASEDALVRAASRLLPHVARAAGSPLAPTFFEILTAAAWLVFAETGCREVVLEVGLGGRLDATNLCRPAAVAIGPIEREHGRILGDSIEAIATEKAGVLKSGVPAVTAAEGTALAVIERRAQEVGAPLEAVGREVRVVSARTGPGPRTVVRIAHPDGDLALEMPVAGAHHGANAAMASRLLRRMGVGAEAVRRGLGALRLPGVIEPVAEDPLVVVDGAHTPASAARTREAVAACWPGREVVLVLGLMEDKDIDGVAGALVPAARAVLCTATESSRAVEPETLARRVRPHARGAVATAPSPEVALGRAREAAGTRGIVLVSGSVHLAGVVRKAVRPTAS